MDNYRNLIKDIGTSTPRLRWKRQGNQPPTHLDILEEEIWRKELRIEICEEEAQTKTREAVKLKREVEILKERRDGARRAAATAKATNP